MKVFNGIAHFFAWVVDTLIPKATTVATDVEAIVGSGAANALLSLAGEQQYQPKLVSVVGSIVSALNTAAQGGRDFQSAAASLGLNPLLDAKAMSDLEDIFNAIKKALGGTSTAIAVSHVVAVK